MKEKTDMLKPPTHVSFWQIKERFFIEKIIIFN